MPPRGGRVRRARARLRSRCRAPRARGVARAPGSWRRGWVVAERGTPDLRGARGDALAGKAASQRDSAARRSLSLMFRSRAVPAGVVRQRALAEPSGGPEPLTPSLPFHVDPILYVFGKTEAA